MTPGRKLLGWLRREEMLQSLAENQGQGNKFCKFLENENSWKISKLKQDIQENFKPPLKSNI